LVELLRSRSIAFLSSISKHQSGCSFGAPGPLELSPSGVFITQPNMALGVDDRAFSEMRHEHVAPLSDTKPEDLMQQLPRVLSDVPRTIGITPSAAPSR
jgi:hypothetical protein